MVFFDIRNNIKKPAGKLSVKQLFCLLFFPGMLFLVSGLGFEQESRVKAAFVYRFCDYVSWPDTAFDTPESPIVIGVSGNRSRVAELGAAVSNKQLGQRTFQVREVVDPTDLQGVHVFYLTHDASGDIDSFIKREDQRPILLITDAGKASPLSVINFLVIDRRIRFEISLVRAEEISLKLSSELLSIAHRVEEKQSP